jgi:hypothetical protein
MESRSPLDQSESEKFMNIKTFEELLDHAKFKEQDEKRKAEDTQIRASVHCDYKMLIEHILDAQKPRKQI